MVASGLLRAVVDGPDGLQPVRLPPDRDGALLMKEQHGNRFWCSRQASGCGGLLRVHAGKIRAPYFQHGAGDAIACVLAANPGRAERTYQHLDIQRILKEWLAAQGITATVEKTLSHGGRADLHFVLDKRRQTIEVQLSRITDKVWKDRDARYRLDVDHVTWLYGPSAETLAATAVVSIGVALEIAHEPGEDNTVQVGTRGHASTAWHPLDDCRLEPDGFWTPGLQEAIEARQRWLSDRAARTSRRPRRIKPIPTVAEQSLSAEAPASPSRAAASRSMRMPDTDSRSFLFQSAVHPEAEAWTPAIGWGWLATLPDDELREPVKLMAYLVQRIYLSGPTERLGFADIDDPEQHIEHCLAAAGLIEIFDVRGICRWRRAS